MGSLTATIVEGNLKDSSATLKALNYALGKASQVTSGSGVIMNNQPLPVQNVKRQSYLGSVSSYTPSTEVILRPCSLRRSHTDLL